MNTNIAHMQDGKWYVVAKMVIGGVDCWYTISEGFATSAEARTEQVEYVMGRKEIK